MNLPNGKGNVVIVRNGIHSRSKLFILKANRNLKKQDGEIAGI
jgi:hypothetical protein